MHDRRAAIVPYGDSPARRLQGARFRRLFHSVYVDARLSVTPSVMARAVALVLPRAASSPETTAALLHGADVRRLADTALEVVVARNDPVRRAGVIARAALLEGGDVTTTEPDDIPG